MDNTTPTAAHRTTILDLPKELLLDIFGYFVEDFPNNDPSKNYRCGSEQLTLLSNNRLVCLAFNTLLSPLLCPVVRVSLCLGSIDRLEGLFRNPLIAQGIRGIAISLRFRPRAVADDFKRYYAHARSILDGLERECDWYTEFQEYERDDESDEAVTWHKYNEAWSRIRHVSAAWRKEAMSRETRLEGAENPKEEGLGESKIDGNEANQQQDEDEDEDEEGTNFEDDEISFDFGEAQALLAKSFAKYAAAQADQARIVSDGSFVRSVTRALSCCSLFPFVWFNERELEGSKSGAISLSADYDALERTLTEGHEWLHIEDKLCKGDDQAGLFFPASILTELPLACHDAGVKLRGIDVGCFPLFLDYCSLLPRATEADDCAQPDPWARFAAACHDLEIFNFGRHGMNCSPIRPERQNPFDLAMINGFIGAAISGPRLQSLHVSLGPFRVRSGIPSREHEERLYQATPIFTAITSKQLRSIVVHNVELSGADLLALAKSASPVHLTYLYFATVSLSQGRYADTMGFLHDITSARSSTTSFKPDIMFASLQGAEFGDSPVHGDDDSDLLFGTPEQREAAWASIEERLHPDLLEEVEQWIVRGKADEKNPLLRFEIPRD